MSVRYLNIGCGKSFHPAWVNADFRARPGIIGVDARERLPFADGEFDVVYHSHMLEHLGHEEGERFLGECHRVLAPSGILRVVVPDFGIFVDEYELLRNQMRNDSDEPTYKKIEWLFIELTDQFARDSSGGNMARYLRGEIQSSQHEFLERRIGYRPAAEDSGTSKRKRKVSLRRSNNRFSLSKLRERVVMHLLGPDDYRALCVGRFRASGEVHRWLFDHQTLKWVLEETGFRVVRSHSPESSDIPRWGEYRLDLADDGRPRMPSSLYIEARK